PGAVASHWTPRRRIDRVRTRVDPFFIGRGLRQDGPAGEDLSTRDGLHVIEVALVFRIFSVFINAKCLHDRQVNQQEDGKQDRKQRCYANGFVHERTSATSALSVDAAMSAWGRRAVLEIRSKMAKRI